MRTLARLSFLWRMISAHLHRGVLNQLHLLRVAALSLRGCGSLHSRHGESSTRLVVREVMRKMGTVTPGIFLWTWMRRRRRIRQGEGKLSFLRGFSRKVFCLGMQALKAWFTPRGATFISSGDKGTSRGEHPASAWQRKHSRDPSTQTHDLRRSSSVRMTGLYSIELSAGMNVAPARS